MSHFGRPSGLYPGSGASRSIPNGGYTPVVLVPPHGAPVQHGYAPPSMPGQHGSYLAQPGPYPGGPHPAASHHPYGRPAPAAAGHPGFHPHGHAPSSHGHASSSHPHSQRNSGSPSTASHGSEDPTDRRREIMKLHNVLSRQGKVADYRCTPDRPVDTQMWTAVVSIDGLERGRGRGPTRKDAQHNAAGFVLSVIPTTPPHSFTGPPPTASQGGEDPANRREIMKLHNVLSRQGKVADYVCTPDRPVERQMWTAVSLLTVSSAAGAVLRRGRTRSTTRPVSCCGHLAINWYRQ